MSHVFYTSDQHIGHKFIAGLRGFDQVAEHDRALAAAWDRTVSAADTVWVLGDISGGSTRAQQAALK